MKFSRLVHHWIGNVFLNDTICSVCEESINSLSAVGFCRGYPRAVPAVGKNIQQSHVWNPNMDRCTECGLGIWGITDNNCMATAQQCCGKTGYDIWNPHQSQWECSKCGAAKSNDPSYLSGKTVPSSLPYWSTPTPSKKCECGSSKVGSDRHSDYCPLYR